MQTCGYCGTALEIRLVQVPGGLGAVPYPYCPYHGNLFVSVNTSSKESPVAKMALVPKRKECERELCDALADLSLLVVEKSHQASRGKLTDFRGVRDLLSKAHMEVDRLLTQVDLLDGVQGPEER